MRLSILVGLTALLLAIPASAHDRHDAPGPNGGRIADAGKYHVERVAADQTVTVYLSDAADKPVPAAGFKALAILVSGGKTLRIPLEPQAGNRLTGQAAAPVAARAKGAVQLTAPDGATASARFN